jgi:membrane fusion protein (multidrug efflux system)
MTLHASARSLLLALVATALALAARAEEEKKPATNVAVHVAPVVRTTLHATVTAFGTVETSPMVERGQPAGGARLAAAAAGLVTAVNGIEGARIAKGAVLVQLDSRAADGAVARAEAAVVAAEKARARQTRLQAADGTSERALQEAEERLAAARGELAAALFQQSQLAIRAPPCRYPHPPDRQARRMARRRSRGWRTRRSPTASYSPPKYPSRTPAPSGQARPPDSSPGSVSPSRPSPPARCSTSPPQVTAGTDQVRVRLALPPGSGLRAGQFLVSRIVTEERPGRLAVPREAVYTDHDGQTTLSIVQGDRAVQKVVKAGLREGNLVEVEGDGVTEGATVVTLGSYALPKETKITVLPAREGDR